MAQKIVTFKVAKALKEAGYPQANNDLYYNENGTVRCCSPHTFTVTYACPTYLSTWLWLWREKNIKIENVHNFATYIYGFEEVIQLERYSDPETAIIEGVNYLIKNNLIK